MTVLHVLIRRLTATVVSSNMSGESAVRAGCKDIAARLASVVRVREVLSANLHHLRHLPHRHPQEMVMPGLQSVIMDSMDNLVN